MTCRIWRERFMANWDEAAKLYDERFCWMWKLYLAVSETAFSHDRLMIFQIQLAKRQDAVPYNREYLAEREADLVRLEQKRTTVDKVEV